MDYQHYTTTERDDAEKVEQAIGLIDGGRGDEARLLLEQVVANCPQFYVYNFGGDNEVYVKFWSLAEYLGYVSLTRRAGEAVEQEVIWLKSAYPRAYYQLAQLALAADDDRTAAAQIDNALRLEPDHPECLLALAEISARAGDVATSLEQFDRALGSRPYMAAEVMARLLAGKARQLVALGRHTEAEQCLEQSLEHGPGNELALNLQQYVKSVEAGDVTAPVSLDTPPPPEPEPPPEQAELAEEPAEPPAVAEVVEEAEPAPQAPPAKPKKRWWQW